MVDSNIDAYIIVTDDYHGSEYVGDYFKEREYMSGFTGSAGTLLVMTDLPDYGLMEDIFAGRGRTGGYRHRAYEERRSGLPLNRSFLYDKLKENGVVGFDGRTVNCNFLTD